MRKQSISKVDYTKEQIVYFSNKVSDLQKQRNEIDKDIKYYEIVLLNLEQSSTINKIVIPQTGKLEEIKNVAGIIYSDFHKKY